MRPPAAKLVPPPHSPAPITRHPVVQRACPPVPPKGAGGRAQASSSPAGPVSPARPHPGGQTIQPRIFWVGVPAIPFLGIPAIGAFTSAGRIAGYNSAPNKRALTSKIRYRHNAPAGTDQNNDHEEALYADAVVAGTVAANSFIKGTAGGTTVNICHKLSSEQVQATLVAAANAANWATVTGMVAGIAPPAVTGDADFDTHFRGVAVARHNAATIALVALVAGGAGINQANLNTLADNVLNSPMNLYIGNATINQSIGGRGDFNSIDTNPAALSGAIRRRRMTAHSDQIYNQLGFAAAGGGALAGTDLLPITLGQAGTAGVGTWQRLWANNAGAAVNGYLTSSVDGADGLGAL
jgi:hypothetical protein